MRGPGALAMIGACGIFAIFFANVVTGAMGGPVFLSDIGEMLTLLAASIIFVIALLYRERIASSLTTQSEKESKTEEY